MGPQGIRARPAAIRTRRTRAGLTVTALAARCGVSRSHLSNVESGRRAASPTVADCIARTLGVQMRTLFQV